VLYLTVAVSLQTPNIRCGAAYEQRSSLVQAILAIPLIIVRDGWHEVSGLRIAIIAN
jgi:hypothetical protein